jgi:hypothetical protein
LRTFGDLKTQLEMELDTEDETFVVDAEVQGYFNTAVTLCESQIVKLGLREKYLQKEAFISTVQGQQDYAIPADIVVNKIRNIIYRNGPIIYKVRPNRGEASYETEDIYAIYPANEYYHYSMYKSGELNIFRITPRALNSVANAFRFVYFGKLNRYVSDMTNCDVPDICYEYILSYVRYRIYGKETHINTAGERADMVALQTLMTETMQNQVADPEMDEMDRDFSHYEEFS